MNVSLIGFCGVGYEGVACATCSQGYAKFGCKIISPKLLLHIISWRNMCELFTKRGILHQIYRLPRYSNSHYCLSYQVSPLLFSPFISLELFLLQERIIMK